MRIIKSDRANKQKSFKSAIYLPAVELSSGETAIPTLNKLSLLDSKKLVCSTLEKLIEWKTKRSFALPIVRVAKKARPQSLSEDFGPILCQFCADLG